MAFQSPAQNYIETRLNLGDLVSLSPYSTYLMRSDSDFTDAGIVKGSVLAIDRALTATHGRLPVRAFFAFDPTRRAIVLCAGDKTGANEKRFYKDMIKLADSEYRKHLAKLEK